MYKSEVISKKDPNMYARVVADSIANDIRITTLELNYWRAIHSEFMTHRMFSRNASSSRAIPVAKMIEQVETAPAMPIHWGKNQSGMQAYEELEFGSKSAAIQYWKDAANNSGAMAYMLTDFGLNVHKQIANRLLEPFQYIRVVVTATEFDNFFALRDHHAAQPEIEELAKLMKQAMAESTPEELKAGEWHLPYIIEKDTALWVEDACQFDWDVARKVSAARCARVSYLNHDKSNSDIQKDLELYDMLATRPYDNGTLKLGIDEPVHLSPTEHQATPMTNVTTEEYQDRMGVIDSQALLRIQQKGITHVNREGQYWSSNFRGWIQHRNLL